MSRIDGIQPIRRIELNHSGIVLLQSIATTHVSSNPGGYNIIMRGYPQHEERKYRPEIDIVQQYSSIYKYPRFEFDRLNG